MIGREAILILLVALSGLIVVSYAEDLEEFHMDSAFGVSQSATKENHDAIGRHLASVNAYMMDLRDSDAELFDKCKNWHSHCALWAISGDCTANEEMMHTLCGPSCTACSRAKHIEDHLGDDEIDRKYNEEEYGSGEDEEHEEEEEEEEEEEWMDEEEF